MPSDSFSLFGPARWTPADRSRTFALVLVANEGEHERRLVERKRPGLEGSPLDDTGSDAKPYTMRALFKNGHGVPDVPDPAYPQYCFDFLEALEQRGKGTSTLYVPGRGEKRVRFKKYHSAQSIEARDAELIDLTFIDDLESEHVTAGAFSLPSAKSAGPVAMRRLRDDARALGVGGDLLDKLEVAVNRMNAAAMAPFDSAAALQQRVGEVLGLIHRFELNLATAPRRLGGGAINPIAQAEASSVHLGLAQLRDNAHKQAGATYGEGSVVERSYPVPLSIYEVATIERQDPGELLNLNARRLPSLVAILPGTPVLVKAA